WPCCGGAGPGRRSPARPWKAFAWPTATRLLLRRKRNVVNEDELLAVGPVGRGLHLGQRLAVWAGEPRPARPPLGPVLALRLGDLIPIVPGVVVQGRVDLQLRDPALLPAPILPEGVPLRDGAAGAVAVRGVDELRPV